VKFFGRHKGETLRDGVLLSVEGVPVTINSETGSQAAEAGCGDRAGPELASLQGWAG
jgi:hypothetical protein